MAFVFGDRVKETSLTTGIGTMALGGAAVGFQSFAVGVGVGNECFYGIVNTADNSWEMGRGTVGPGALSRDTVISSSNSNLAVNLVAGQKVVYTTIPDQFYDSLLDAPAHAAINHTLAPFNLLDATAHQGVDHTAAPFNLLATANLGIEHALIDHKSAPFNLLDSAAHAVIDHKAAPFNLLDAAAHSSINHFTLITNAIPQVTGPEKTAGTSTFLRSYSPLDIADMAGVHGGGGPVGKLAQYTRTVTSAPSSGFIGATPPGLQLDNSIFTTSVGIPGMSHSHTPLNAANTLVIRIQHVCDGGFGGALPVGLFKDAEVNARDVFFEHLSAVNAPLTRMGSYQMTAGGVAPIMFSTRFSTQLGQTLYFNQRANFTTQGGVMKSWIEVWEIEP